MQPRIPGMRYDPKSGAYIATSPAVAPVVAKVSSQQQSISKMAKEIKALQEKVLELETILSQKKD